MPDSPYYGEDLERRARELKLTCPDYAGALRVRLELEDWHARSGAGVHERTRNLNQLALLAVHAGVLGEAERAARECVELYRPIATERDERLATYVMMLSAVLAEARNFEEAVVHGERAVEMFAAHHGAQDSFVLYRKRDVDRMRAGDTGPYLDEA
jgi:hypothetical protein